MHGLKPAGKIPQTSLSTNVQDAPLKETYPFLWQLPFVAVDRQLALYLQRDEHVEHKAILLGAACAMAATRLGHSYLDLVDPPFDEWEYTDLASQWPSIETWRAALAPYRANPEKPLQPLVFEEESRLYLQKYYAHERALAQSIREAAQSSAPHVDLQKPDAVLSSLFAADTSTEDPQYRAIVKALDKNLFIITGGPGTGKTTTILKVISARLQLSIEKLPRIALAAPTGKAAARLHNSISSGLAHIAISDRHREQIPDTAQTLHRLLGSIPNSVSFRCTQKNPLPYDLIVVDEASMIDLPLMRRFLDAVRSDCQVILIGDPDQLSSVQVGSVLNDIVQAASIPESKLAKNHAHLDKTYRFDSASGIGALCSMMQESRAIALGEILETFEGNPNLEYKEIGLKPTPTLQTLAKHAVQQVLARRELDTPEAALKSMGQSQMLCPTKTGPLGTFSINSKISEYVLRTLKETEDQAFSGQPILVLENNYDLELFNGDLGVIWAKPNKSLMAWFHGPEGTVKSFELIQLPKYETAFAMTIHKSQGSEFEHVSIIIPAESSRILSRELIYTATSRARTSLDLYASPDSLQTGINNHVVRATGLARRLVKESA